MALETIKSTFVGTWKHDRSDNLEAYLNVMDLGTIKKAAVMKMNPTMVITVNGETIEVNIKGGPADMISVKNKFKLDETFQGDFGGIKAAGLTKFIDGRMEIDFTPTDTKKPKQKVIRKITNGELEQTMIVGDVTAKRIFKKV